MTQKSNKYELKNYGKSSTFASFLPGIAGIKGVPIWCFYVNRGQGIVSFGVENKDHAIMEFYPAHQSYQNVKRTGFRTFILKDGKYTEAFHDEAKEHAMHIHKNVLELEEVDVENGIKTEVAYFVLPEEPLGALARRVTVTNLGKEATFQIIDGMPAVVPYGVGTFGTKNMTQTAKAWMQVEDSETGLGYYRVRASMEDTASVSDIAGGNFAVAVDQNGDRLKLFVDPESMFDYDLGFEKPVRFVEGGLEAVEAQKQNISNLLPGAFFGKVAALKENESLTIYELIGQVENKEILDGFVSRVYEGEKSASAYFEEKYARAFCLAEEICKGIETKTGDPVFDEYCKYTYMDNLLRGGFPMRLGNNKIFYVYSRKHGDTERDYNYFTMLPEYYTQGNGNFRDVNQNRRCDSFFSPFVGRENILLFYSLIQLDGYNPLGIEKLTYKVEESKAKTIAGMVDKALQKELYDFITKSFTPGKLYQKMESLLKGANIDELFGTVIDFATANVNGNFGEGYWCDHWTYNLDLVEEYVSLYPEKEEEMLDEQVYTYFLSQVNVNRRAKRYVKTPKGIRQYNALDEEGKRNTEEKLVRAQFQSGDVVYSSLLEKLIMMCTVKFATLDAYGMGIEMEGGKPGWYDALNGMPGMMGSSMSETYELARMLSYTISVLKKYPGKVSILKEAACLLEELYLINRLEEAHIKADKEILSFWNKINDAKEIYRDKTYQGISGEKKEFSRVSVCEMLESFLQTVECGIEKAVSYGDGICPTYFTYDITDYDENCEGIHPKHFEMQMVPYFLEGPVRYMKLPISADKKKTLYDAVKSSALYDKKLSMYKVNASLNEGSFELGRARAFTPGWLENESIWLHMEYKYLLELIKNGMYEEFAEDFHKAAIPFLDPNVYGRSTLENSSFIASSNNPNEKIHGKGFVARLSGSTVEFLSIWRRMMFGEQPFRLEKIDETMQLCAEFKPALPDYLIGADKEVSARFMGDCVVTYHLDEVKDYFPGKYQIAKMEVCFKNGTKASVEGGVLVGQMAKMLRDGKIRSVDVVLKK